jgi:beta-lactamase regulating signal transducer with metallopeptidase domain
MNPLLFSTAAVAMKGTALLAIAWALHGLLRNSHPALRMTMWRVVAVSLIALPVVEFLAPTWTSPKLGPALAPLAVASEEFATSRFTAPAVPAFVATTVNSSKQEARSLSVGAIAASLWFLGVLVIAGREVRSHARLRKLVRASVPAPEHVVQRADAIAREIGIGPSFDVRISTEANSPFITGLRHPVIVIPTSLLDDSRELDAVLAHELTHRAGADHRWAFVAQIARLAWWAHPLVWGIGAAHRAACEENSDAVTAKFDGDSGWYSAFLARLALSAAGAQPTGALSMMSGSEIMHRLRILAERGTARPPRTVTTLTLAATLLAMTAVCGTLRIAPTAQAQQAPAERNLATTLPAPDAELVAKMEVRGDLAARQAHVPEILALLESDDADTRAKGIAVLVATSNLKYDRTSLSDALRRCLDDANPAVQVYAFNVLAVSGNGAVDLDTISRLADSKDERVLEAVGNSVYYFDPKNTDPRRDAIVMKLLNHKSEFVQKEVLRGSWGFSVSEVVETKMIEISRRPSMTYNAVYFGLSTRPVKSVAVATRLIEVMKTEKDWNATSRAVWALAISPCVPEARETIMDALIEQFDETNDPQGMREIVRHLGSCMCEFERAKAKLQQIAADDSFNEELRKRAEELVAQAC